MLFGRDHEDSHGCPVGDTSGPDIIPLGNGMTFHNLAVIVSGACTAFAVLVSIFLIMNHAVHFSNPREQTLIMRMILMLPLCAIIAFLCVWLDSAAAYLKPAIEVVESLALSCFFLLMLAYIYPDDDMRQGLFAKLDLRPTKKKKGKMKWYEQCWISVFQFPPVAILVWIITVITLAAGVFCETSNKPKFAHIWMTVLQVASTTSTLASIFITYSILKEELKPFNALSKFVTFKLIIFLNFVQTTIFSLLMSSNTLKPTNHLTYNNIYYALPNMILCIEMALISPLFVYAYTPKPYYRKNRPNGFANYHSSSSYGFKALWSIINISDLLRGLLFAVEILFSSRGRSKSDYHPEVVNQAPPAYPSPSHRGYQGLPNNGVEAVYGHPEISYDSRYQSERFETPMGSRGGYNGAESEMYPLRG